MISIIYMPLKVISINVYGIWWRRYEFSKQLQDLLINVALLSETRLNPYERFFFQNYDFYHTERFPGRKDIQHNHVYLCYICDTYIWQKRSLFSEKNPSSR
jgi:hypothetical protein